MAKGIRDFNRSPRFSTGYVPLRNRPAILIETHMLKNYRSRVPGTYDFLRAALEEVGHDPQRLLTVVHDADEKVIAAGRTYDPAKRYPLNFDLTEKSTPYHVRAIESHTEMSEISGGPYVTFGTKPIELTVPMYNDFRVTSAVAPPLYYIVPAQWEEVIEVIRVHGLYFQTLHKPENFEIESYRFSDVKWAGGPFEGRLMPSFKVETVREHRIFPAGSVIIPLAQQAARVAINLLEPEAPDSLVHWGFSNAIFEQKEYGENYVLEKLAREMLAKDPKLKQEYEQKLASDPQFAANARARLEFFYRRSPYWDAQMGLYPVGRITTPLNLTVGK